MTMTTTNTWQTPTKKKEKKEDYDDYDISPPKRQDRRSFDNAVRAINKDFKDLLVEWETKEKIKVVWFKINGDTKVELPFDFRRILLFLYSRNFKKHVGKDIRKEAVKKLLQKGQIRKAMLQVIRCTGDRSLVYDENYRAHYIRVCMTIHRYFQLSGATGFVADMSSAKYYLRVQKFGSCFLQAACVTMSYLLHAHGRHVPPANASRLIRHHFDDEQLINYADNNGGDSVGIFKILEKKFFICHTHSRDPTLVLCQSLYRKSKFISAVGLLEDGPGLVSKFRVPESFQCSPPSCDLKQKFPSLAQYTNWDDIPAECVPPGFVRFTKWNEPGEFIPLDDPSNASLEAKESLLKENWNALLLQFADVDAPDITASRSADSCFAESDSLGTSTEASTNSAPTLTICDTDSDGEDWSIFFDEKEDDENNNDIGDDDDNDDIGDFGNNDDNDGHQDDNKNEVYEDCQHGEGDSKTLLHAMILLGYRIVNDSGYWLIQNSWDGPMQILEVSTDFLIRSEAYIYFYDRDYRNPKPENQCRLESLGGLCLLPIAESSQLERNDCADWTDAIVHPRSSSRDHLSLDTLIMDP